MIYGAITNPTVVGHGVRTEYQVRLGYKVNSQNIESNTSNITLQLEARTINSSYYSYGFKQTSKIDGVTLSAKDFSVRQVNVWQVFGTRTFDVTHDENGEYKQTKNASFTTNASDSDEWILKSGSASVEVELEKLHTPPLINGLEVSEENIAINDAGVVVQFLSQKKIGLDVSTYEDSQLVETRAYNNGVLLSTSTTNELSIDFSTVENLAIIKDGERKYCVLTFEAIDNMGGIGTTGSEFDVVEYFKPNLIQTSSNVKRNGQASGKVKLNLVGKFFNESTDVLTNTINLQFAYWKKNEEESTTFYDIPFEKTNNDIILSDYALGIDGVEIENVDKDYAYYFKIKATDAFENSSEIILLCPVGEYVWAEFKDRVDFKKITIKNENPFEYSREERMVGIWEDGRPLYRRYIDIGNLATSVSKDVDLTTYGIDASEVKFMEVYKKDPSGVNTSINPAYVTMAGAVVCRTILYKDATTNILRIANGNSQNLSTHTAYAILFYTKTND